MKCGDLAHVYCHIFACGFDFCRPHRPWVRRRFFNFVFREIFFEFSRIFAKYEIKIWVKFLQFRETRNQTLGTKYLQKLMIFSRLKKCKNIHTLFVKSKWILIIVHLWQRKFCFTDFLKAQK